MGGFAQEGSAKRELPSAEVDRETLSPEEVQPEKPVDGCCRRQRVGNDGEVRPLLPERLQSVQRESSDVLDSTEGYGHTTIAVPSGIVPV